MEILAVIGVSAIIGLVVCIGLSLVEARKNNKELSCDRVDESSNKNVIASTLQKADEAMQSLKEAGCPDNQLYAISVALETATKTGDLDAMKKPLAEITKLGKLYAEKRETEEAASKTARKEALFKRAETMLRGHRFGQATFEDIKALIDAEQFDLAEASLDRHTKKKSSSAAPEENIATEEVA